MSIHFFKTALILAGVALLGAVIFSVSGMFHPAADEPHWRITYNLLNFVRERGIATRAQGIEVPNLDDPALIRSGAGNYAAMCVGCHLGPGMPDGEIQLGMYPAPPNLSAGEVLEAGRTFWIIKHGIKMSGMPAWGKSMGDAPIWGMTAFVRQLPAMTAEQYKALIASSGGHDHGDGNATHHADGDGPSDGDAEKPTHAGMAGMAADDHDGAGEAAHSHSDAANDKHVEMPGIANMDHGAMAAMNKKQDRGNQSNSTQAKDHSSMPGMDALPKAPPRRISGPAEAALQAFQDALQVGNRDLALQWLAPDVMVVEDGKTEPSRADYASHHLGSDMAFLKSSKVVLLDRRVQQDDHSARILSTSRIVGRAGAKPIDITSKEIAALKNTADGWRIVRLEWLSQPTGR